MSHLVMEDGWGVMGEGFDEGLCEMFSDLHRSEGEACKSISDFCDEFDNFTVQSLIFQYEYIFYFVPSLPKTQMWRRVKKKRFKKANGIGQIKTFTNQSTGRLTYEVHSPGNSGFEALRNAKEQMEDYSANNPVTEN